MAGFGWNMRQGNMHGPQNHATQIACRICDRVFISTQALLNHIETHMANGGESAVARRQNHHNQIVNPNFQNYFPLENPLQPIDHSGRGHVSQETNPFLVSSNPRSVLNQYWLVPPKNLSPLLSRKDLVFGQQLPLYKYGQQTMQNQQSSSCDFTKPLIDQLLKNIPDLERGDDKNRVYESDMLDLTLKL